MLVISPRYSILSTRICSSFRQCLSSASQSLYSPELSVEIWAMYIKVFNQISLPDGVSRSTLAWDWGVPTLWPIYIKHLIKKKYRENIISIPCVPSASSIWCVAAVNNSWSIVYDNERRLTFIRVIKWSIILADRLSGIFNQFFIVFTVHGHDGEFTACIIVCRGIGRHRMWQPWDIWGWARRDS